MAQISKRLVVKKEIPMDNSKDLVNSLDIALAEYHCTNKDYEKGLKIYREILPQLNDFERNKTLHKYIDFSLQYAQEKTKDKKWVEAVEIYRDIMKYSGFPINVYKNIGLCMKNLGIFYSRLCLFGPFFHFLSVFISKIIISFFPPPFGRK